MSYRRWPTLEDWLVALDPTRGSEIRKTRPCLIVSPDEINESLRTVIIAPMTTTKRAYLSRIGLTFQGKQGQVALDQIRAIDRERLVRKLGIVSTKTANAVSATLVQMFARAGQAYNFLL